MNTIQKMVYDFAVKVAKICQAHAHERIVREVVATFALFDKAKVPRTRRKRRQLVVKVSPVKRRARKQKLTAVRKSGPRSGSPVATLSSQPQAVETATPAVSTDKNLRLLAIAEAAARMRAIREAWEPEADIDISAEIEAQTETELPEIIETPTAVEENDATPDSV